MENLEQILAGHPFFGGIDATYIKLLSGCAKHVQFPKGAYIYREGSKADTFYCLRAGKVTLEIHAPQSGSIQIDSRKAGDVFGWSWIVEPFRWYCDVRVIEEVRALALDAKYIRDRCQEDKIFGYEMYRRLVPLMHQSLQATRLQLIDVYGPD